MPFEKACKKKTKLRLWLNGMSSSGKTYSALLIAKGLGGKIALIDSEAGRGHLYGDKFDYDVFGLTAPFTPEKYIAAIKEAEAAGYNVIIVDSASHEWVEVLGIKTKLDERPGSNQFTNWASPTRRHNSFIESVIQSPCHVIVTSRVKRDWMLVEENGKHVPKCVGLANVQREGIEYEFTTEFRIEQNHHATAIKDNTRLFLDKGDFLITEDTGKQLIAWLNEGKEEIIKQPVKA